MGKESVNRKVKLFAKFLVDAAFVLIIIAFLVAAMLSLLIFNCLYN